MQDGYQGSTLQVAVSNGNEKMVELLLAAGANVNVERFKRGEASAPYRSALYEASERGREKIVELLLKTSADGYV